MASRSDIFLTIVDNIRRNTYVLLVGANSSLLLG